MRRISTVILALVLLIGSVAPVSATVITAAKLDVCPNIDGIQTQVPKGYRLVETPDESFICLPK